MLEKQLCLDVSKKKKLKEQWENLRDSAPYFLPLDLHGEKKFRQVVETKNVPVLQHVKEVLSICNKYKNGQDFYDI